MDFKVHIGWILFVICLLMGNILLAQAVNLGRLPIKNYPKSSYQAGTQNWDMAQDKQGVMYFANNDGMLRFDGSFWTLHPISNNTIIRSIALTDDGRIYIGAQGEMGYFYPDQSGHLVYHSLLENIPEAYRDVADIWAITSTKDYVFFQSSTYIFVLNKAGEFLVTKTERGYSYMGRCGQEVYVQEDGRGLLKFDKRVGKFQPFLETSFVVTELLPFSENEILMVSLKQGLFLYDGTTVTPWANEYNDFFKNKRIYCARSLADQQFAIGTTLGGIIILDQKGQAVRHIDKIAGLQNTNILSLFTDASNNLWAGLNNGIDYIEVQSAITQILPDYPLDGTGYDVLINEGHVYMATSTGLFINDWQVRYTPKQQRSFELIEGTAGQNWGLSNIYGDVLLGHHEGSFQINKKEARRFDSNGTWRYLPFGKNKALSGHYQGMYLLEKENQIWQSVKRMEGFDESCRVLARHNDKHVWMTHPYRGVYRLSPSSKSDSLDVIHYTEEDGLPSNLNIYVFDVNDQALFATTSGVYLYDEVKDVFYPDSLFNNVLGKESWVKFLANDAEGNIWYVTDEEVGFLAISEKGLSVEVNKKEIPGIKNRLVGGFERVYPYDKENIFLGAEKGFLHFNPTRFFTKPKADFPVLLHQVEVMSLKDSIVAGSYFLQQQESKNNMVFSPKNNAFRFSFSTPWFDGENPVLYRCRLEGLDTDWSIWSEKTEREYTNLSSGNYVFHVQAKKEGEFLQKELHYPFIITAPWYATTMAKIGYVLLLLGIFAGTIFAQSRKYKAAAEELKSEYEDTVEQQEVRVQQTEAELVQVRNEALETELQFRQKELATNAMHLMQKGELLNTIKEELQKSIKKNQNTEQLKSEINKVINMMEQDNLLDESWEQFIFHFNQVHAGFFTKLREQFPNLTSYDQKMCAYLRMNLTTKEIASLLNISVRGVEGGRYRLRKKMELNADTNLVTFIQQI